MYLDDACSDVGDVDDVCDAIMNFCRCSSAVGDRGRFDNEIIAVTASTAGDVTDSVTSPCSRGSTAMMMLFPGSRWASMIVPMPFPVPFCDGGGETEVDLSSSLSSSQWSVRMCLPKSRGFEKDAAQMEQGNLPSPSDIFET